MTNKEETLTYKPYAGQRIRSAAEGAIALSGKTGKKVRFEFNNRSVVVTPENTLDQVLDLYEAAENQDVSNILLDITI